MAENQSKIMQQIIEKDNSKLISPRMELVLDQIASEEDSFKPMKPVGIQEHHSLENIDLESKLQIDVAGPRWLQDHVLYQGHYEFNV